LQGRYWKEVENNAMLVSKFISGAVNVVYVNVREIYERMSFLCAETHAHQQKIPAAAAQPTVKLSPIEAQNLSPVRAFSLLYIYQS
jgi:hypothetical protein